MRFGSICASVLVCLSPVLFSLSPASAGVYTMTDANSTAVVDTAGGGMNNWTIDGVNNLNRQWFWYRTGTVGGESNVGSLLLDLAAMSDLNHDGVDDSLYVRYLGTNLKIELSFTLTGGSAGSRWSDIAETIKISNTSKTTALDMHFFQYVNLQLNGSAINDSVEITGGNTARQTFGPTTISETVETPRASHYEVGFAPGTLNSLEDGAPTTLSDLAGPVGPGDLNWAFQWDMTLAPGGSYIISKDKQVVPEPGTMLLALPLAWALRRRRA